MYNLRCNFMPLQSELKVEWLKSAQSSLAPLSTVDSVWCWEAREGFYIFAVLFKMWLVITVAFFVALNCLLLFLTWCMYQERWIQCGRVRLSATFSPVANCGTTTSDFFVSSAWMAHQVICCTFSSDILNHKDLIVVKLCRSLGELFFWVWLWDDSAAFGKDILMHMLSHGLTQSRNKPGREKTFVAYVLAV